MYRKKSPKSHADERYDFPTPDPVVVAAAAPQIRPPEDIELQRPLRLNQPSSAAPTMNQQQQQHHEFVEPRSVRIYYNILCDAIIIIITEFILILIAACCYISYYFVASVGFFA